MRTFCLRPLRRQNATTLLFSDRFRMHDLVNRPEHRRAASVGNEAFGENTWLTPISCPVLSHEITLQDQRCKQSQNEPESIFEQWCKSSGGVRTLESAFKVQPFPTDYFVLLEKFQDRVLGPGNARISRKILLSTAFMHKSWLNAGAARAKHFALKEPRRAKETGVHNGLFSRSAVLFRANEGLELLGDSIIKCAATEMLLRERPLDSLDALNERRAMLENNQMLGIASLNHWLTAPLLLFDSQQMEASRQSIGHGGIAVSAGYLNDAQNKAFIAQAANALEAVLGAVALEHGHARSISFAQEHLLPALKLLLQRQDLKLGGEEWNPIKTLQHRMHKLSGVNVTFRQMPNTAAASGATKARKQLETAVFKVGCYTMTPDGDENTGKLLGVGYGASLVEARKDAAAKILPKLDRNKR